MFSGSSEALWRRVENSAGMFFAPFKEGSQGAIYLFDCIKFKAIFMNVKGDVCDQLRPVASL